MNKVILNGRLTAKPELRTTQSGSQVVKSTVAVNRNFVDKNTGKREADFITVSFWGKTAETVSKYCNKGDLIEIEGSMRTSKSTGNDGKTKYFTEVLAEHIEFLQSKPKEEKKNMEEMSNNDIIRTVATSEDPYKEFASEVALSDELSDLPF